MRNLICLLLFLFFSLMAFSSCGKQDTIFELLYEEGDSALWNKISVDSLGDRKDSTNNDSTYSEALNDSIVVKWNSVVGLVVNSYEKYMNMNSGGVSVQGAAAFGDYLFQFSNYHTAVFIYNLKEKRYVDSVAMNRSGEEHCNEVAFSNIYYAPTDVFPLLYVSGGTTKTGCSVQVYRITQKDSEFTIIKVQDIIMPSTYHGVEFYWPSVTLNNDKRQLVIYSYNDGQPYSYITTLNIPNSKASKVELGEKDVIDCYAVNPFATHQGAVVKNDILYVIDGVPSWGDRVLLYAIDLKGKRTIGKADLMTLGFRDEPEDICFYNGQLLCVTNFNRGIFKINYQLNGSQFE